MKQTDLKYKTGRPADNKAQRFTKTGEALIKAMCVLAKEKSLYRITVAELAAKANISRGTFYLHFSDIYDMYEKIEKYVLKKAETYLSECPEPVTEEAYAGFIEKIVDYIEQNSELLELLFTMNSFRGQIMVFLDRFYLETRKKFDGGKAAAEKGKYLTRYHTCGIIAVVEKWLEEDDVYTKEDLTAMIMIFDAAFDDMVKKNCLCNPARQ